MKTNKINSNFIDLLLPEGILDMQNKGGIPSPELINEWNELKERTLFVNTDIDETIVDYISYYIRKWNIDDEALPVEIRTPIKIFINTNGGLLNDTMHCCDMIKASKTPVYTICQGYAYSSGGLLLIAGHKRFCYQSSTYLLHAGSTGMGGNATTVFDTLDFQKSYEKRVKAFVVKNTKFSEEDYDKNYRKELYLDSDGMLEHGIVDAILTEII